MRKDKCIKVHVSAEQLAVCSKHAKKMGLSLSAYMLNAGLSVQRGAARNDILRDIAQREKLLVAIERAAAIFASRTISSVDAVQILKLLEVIKNKTQSIGSFRKGAKCSTVGHHIRAALRTGSQSSIFSRPRSQNVWGPLRRLFSEIPHPNCWSDIQSCSWRRYSCFRSRIDIVQRP